MSIHVNDFVCKYVNIVCILFTDMLYVYVRYSYQCQLLIRYYYSLHVIIFHNGQQNTVSYYVAV